MMQTKIEPVLDALYAAEYDLSITVDSVTVLRSEDTYSILYNRYSDYIMTYGKPDISPVNTFKSLWATWVYRMTPNISKMFAGLLADYDPTVRRQIQKYFASADQRDTDTEVYTPAGTKTETNAHTGSITDTGNKDTSIYGFNSGTAAPSEDISDGNTRTFTNTDTKTDSFTDYSETRTKTPSNTLTMSTPAGDFTGHDTHFDYNEVYEIDNAAAMIAANIDLYMHDYAAELLHKFVNDNFYYVGTVSAYDGYSI